MTGPTRRQLIGLLAVTALQPVGAAWAHALPGAVVTVMPRADRVILRIEVALDDLSIVLPEAGLGADPLTDTQERAVTGYLADHVDLTSADGTRFRLNGTGLALYPAENDHVGRYTLLVAELFLHGKPVFPLTLTYDVVMHEVRSHVAVVYLTPENGQPRGMGEVRINPASGLAAPLVIDFLP